MIVNQVKCLPMSALGQKRTSEQVQSMSALPPIADIGTQSRNVRFVPKADKVSNVIRGFAPDLAPVFLLSQWKYEFKAGATGVCL
jgi:hypothetical protein